MDGNTVIANTEDGQETVYQTNHIGPYFTYSFGSSDGLSPGQAYTVRTGSCLIRPLQLVGAAYAFISLLSVVTEILVATSIPPTLKKIPHALL